MTKRPSSLSTSLISVSVPWRSARSWSTTSRSLSMQESGSPVLLEHLFRREAGRIVAWLSGLLGSANLQLAEDAAQEAMLRAAQTWPFQGIPPKPEAWLFRTAHNYAISSVRRSAVFKNKADALVVALETGTQPILDLDAEQSL